MSEQKCNHNWETHTLSSEDGSQIIIKDCLKCGKITQKIVHRGESENNVTEYVLQKKKDDDE